MLKLLTPSMTITAINDVSLMEWVGTTFGSYCSISWHDAQNEGTDVVGLCFPKINVKMP